MTVTLYYPDDPSKRTPTFQNNYFLSNHGPFHPSFTHVPKSAHFEVRVDSHRLDALLHQMKCCARYSLEWTPDRLPLEERLSKMVFGGKDVPLNNFLHVLDGRAVEDFAKTMKLNINRYTGGAEGDSDVAFLERLGDRWMRDVDWTDERQVNEFHEFRVLVRCYNRIMIWLDLWNTAIHPFPNEMPTEVDMNLITGRRSSRTESYKNTSFSPRSALHKRPRFLKDPMQSWTSLRAKVDLARWRRDRKGMIRLFS